MTRVVSIMLGALVGLSLAGTARAQGAKPLKKCAPDAVLSGTVCMDRYEATVWRIPDPLGANKSLVKKAKAGKATVADLSAGGAAQLGTASDDYAPCANNGQNCTNDIYAVSLAGETPAAHITWFQAQQACINAGKRLPTNDEWHAAAVGTPDPGPDNGTTDCNSTSFSTTPTGSRSACVSADGAFDMVGNLYEWVAEWMQRANTCGEWDVSPTGDSNCMGGATVTGDPGALVRGGSSSFAAAAGPLAIYGDAPPSISSSEFGFRCAR